MRGSQVKLTLHLDCVSKPGLNLQLVKKMPLCFVSYCEGNCFLTNERCPAALATQMLQLCINTSGPQSKIDSVTLLKEPSKTTKWIHIFLLAKLLENKEQVRAK